MDDLFLKHKRGKALHSGGKYIVQNVFNSLKGENSGIFGMRYFFNIAKNIGLGIAILFGILKKFKKR